MPRHALLTNILRCAIAAGTVMAAVAPGEAADLFRHRHRHHRHGGLAAYRDDRVCPIYEPRDYRPRTINEPLCYAVRPYGISQHLYDRSPLLDRVDDSPDGY